MQLKILSFNTKRFPNPLRAVAIKKWMVDNSLMFDFICLEEIKCGGSTLEVNLKKLGPQFEWYLSAHEVGKGGTTIGVYTNNAFQIESVCTGNNFVCINLEGVLNCDVVSVYAPYNP